MNWINLDNTFGKKLYAAAIELAGVHLTYMEFIFYKLFSKIGWLNEEKGIVCKCKIF